MAQINFLQQGIGHIRQSVIDIDDSYNNDWDILAELIQNSVDAIRKAERKTDGKLTITVNCQSKTIVVEDNGIGIENKDIPALMCMFGTNKKDDERSVGEKGVGLKFAIFSCNDFSLKTHTQSGSSYARVVDAYNWKIGTEEKELPLEYDRLNEDGEGTSVTLNRVIDCPIFDLTFHQLKYVLRTKTAVGNTISLWDEDDIDISVFLKYVNPDGREETEKIPFRYWLPYEGLAPTDKISMTEYYEYIRTDRTDQQKRIKLKNKVIYHTKKFDQKNRNINAVICFVPKRATWESLTQNAKLATEEQLSREEFLQAVSYATLQPGIYTSVKGMPTGIRVEHPITGSAGTWGQVFMLFEDRKLRFDIGRKSIHGKTARIYQEYARDLFNEFRKTFLKYVSGDIPEVASWDKDEVFKEIEGLVDLKNDITKFLKTPRDQEGTVAALFFEAIGNGNITQISPLVSGYKNRYDLYAMWEGKRVVMEFKSNLYKIIKDFNDETKLFNEVDCVVCWDVSEDDAQQFRDVGITLEEVPEESILNPSVNKFPNSTHVLRLSGMIKPIYVIDMKILLKGKSVG